MSTAWNAAKHRPTSAASVYAVPAGAQQTAQRDTDHVKGKQQVSRRNGNGRPRLWLSHLVVSNCCLVCGAWHVHVCRPI